MLDLDDADLILADAIPEPEVSEDALCHVEPCGRPADVSLGQIGEMELCAGHAAQLLVQLVANLDVQAVLVQRGLVAKAMTLDELRDLRALLLTTVVEDAPLKIARARWQTWIKAVLEVSCAPVPASSNTLP